jgi:hypothetical protein
MCYVADHTYSDPKRTSSRYLIQHIYMMVCVYIYSIYRPCLNSYFDLTREILRMGVANANVSFNGWYEVIYESVCSGASSFLHQHQGL